MNKKMSVELQRFNVLSAEIDGVYHEAALKMGLSDSALMILYMICNSGTSCPLSDIAGLPGISKQTVNSALRKLEGEGIVYLEDLNRRTKKVCLTEKGKELSDRTAMRLMEIENGIFDSWTPEERELYLTLTQRYLEAMKNCVRKL